MSKSLAWYNNWPVFKGGPVVNKGGPGSGFHGHSGRPGQRGGSASGGNITTAPDKAGKINSVSDAWWDKKNRYGNVTVNGHSRPIGLRKVGYKSDGFTPIKHLSVDVAHDYNRTGRFTITAPGLKSLINKLARYEKGKLVKPAQR